MSDIPGFDAFFSYASEPDAVLVRQLERFLEGFHRHPFFGSKALKPLSICVDGTDLRIRSGEGLSTVEAALTAHLRSSRRLVVFCSANAKTSAFVDTEIRWWLANRDAQSIIPVITEGTDAADIRTRVFPPALIEAGLHEALWLDLRGARRPWFARWIKSPRARSAAEERLRLAALLHDYAATPLPWQRTRRLQAAVGLAAAALSVCTAAGWYAWTQTDTYAMHQILGSELIDADLRTDRLIRSRIGQLIRAHRQTEAYALGDRLPGEKHTTVLCEVADDLYNQDAAAAAAALLGRIEADASTRKGAVGCLDLAFVLGRGAPALGMLKAAAVDGPSTLRKLEHLRAGFVSQAAPHERDAVIALAREQLFPHDYVSTLLRWAREAPPDTVDDFINAVEQASGIVSVPDCSQDLVLRYNEISVTEEVVHLLVRHGRTDSAVRWARRLCEVKDPQGHVIALGQPLQEDASLVRAAVPHANIERWTRWARTPRGVRPRSRNGYCEALAAGLVGLPTNAMNSLLSIGAHGECDDVKLPPEYDLRDIELAKRLRVTGNARLALNSEVLDVESKRWVYWALVSWLAGRFSELPTLRTIAKKYGPGLRPPPTFDIGEPPDPLLRAMMSASASGPGPVPAPDLDSMDWDWVQKNGACVYVRHGLGRSLVGESDAVRQGSDAAIVLMNARIARRGSSNLDWPTRHLAATCIAASLAAQGRYVEGLSFAHTYSQEPQDIIKMFTLMQAADGQYAVARRTAQFLNARSNRLETEGEILERWLQR